MNAINAPAPSGSKILGMMLGYCWAFGCVYIMTMRAILWFCDKITDYQPALNVIRTEGWMTTLSLIVIHVATVIVTVVSLIAIRAAAKDT